MTESTRLDVRQPSPRMSPNSINKRAMKTNRPSKLLDTGWTRIPNCSNFEKEETKLNPHWLKLGIEKKLPSKKTITPYINEPLNKYMLYQIRRLKGKRVSDPEAYWKIVWRLVTYSTCFRISALHHVLTNWYKELPFWEIKRINTEVTRIFERKWASLEYHRVYIPKGEAYRPLGVPTREWRVALHMMSNFIHMFTASSLLPTQHGFIPGRGCLTAWKEVMTKVIDKEWVFECDLKQFFPSVKVKKVTDILTSMEMPLGTAMWLQAVNFCQPILPKELLLDETHSITDHYAIDSTRGYGSARKFGAEYNYMVGLPQGAPTSPLLSILTLSEFLQQQGSISYADDPIFYGDEEFKIKEFPLDGIVLNQGKSGWVKRQGTWMSPLKYLGLVYDPLTDTLSGNTRKGSRLALSHTLRDKILSIFAPKASKNWKSLFALPDMGMIFSRLYTGSWKTAYVDQDFRLSFRSDSMAGKIRAEYGDDGVGFKNTYNTFNISSACCQKLAAILRKKPNPFERGFKRLELDYTIAKKTKKLQTPPTVEEDVSDEVLFGTSTITRPLYPTYNMERHPRASAGPDIRLHVKLPIRQKTDGKSSTLGAQDAIAYYDNRVEQFLKTAESTDWREDIELSKLMPSEKPSSKAESYENQLIKEIRESYERNQVAPEPLIKVDYPIKRGTRDLVKEFRQKFPDHLKPAAANPEVKTTPSHKPGIRDYLPADYLFKDTFTMFIVGFLLTFFYLYRNDPGYTSPTVFAEEKTSWIEWLLVSLLIFLFLGWICWYTGIITPPRSPKPLSSEIDYERSIQILQETNNHLTNQIQELNQYKEHLSTDLARGVENLELSRSDLAKEVASNEGLHRWISHLHSKLESVQTTLFVVRRENANLNQQLRTDLAELNRTNEFIEITERQVSTLHSKLTEILTSINSGSPDTQGLIENTQVLLNDSPVLNLLSRISQYSNLDITSATLIRTQATERGDQILVFCDGDSFGRLIQGLSQVHSYMMDHPDLVNAAETISNF